MSAGEETGTVMVSLLRGDADKSTTTRTSGHLDSHTFGAHTSNQGKRSVFNSSGKQIPS